MQSLSDVVAKMKAAGFKLTVEAGRLVVSPASRLTTEQRAWIRAHRDEIVAELQRQRAAASLAVLLTLPDGFRFWLAPDDLEFETGGIPVLRRSVMDKLETAGEATAEQLRAVITSMRELGGELKVPPPVALEKRDSGEMSAPIAGEARP